MDTNIESKEKLSFIKNLITHLFWFGFVFTIILISFSKLILILILIISAFSMILFPGSPIDLEPVGIIPFFTYGALFVATTVVIRIVTSKHYLNYIYFLLFSLISVIFESFLSFLLCSGSYFCTKMSIKEVLLSIITQYIIVIAAFLFSLIYKRSIFWLLFIYFSLLLIIFLGWMTIGDFNLRKKSFLFNKVAPSKFETYTIPETSLSFVIPKISPSTRKLYSFNFDREKITPTNNQFENYPNYKNIYETYLEENNLKNIGNYYNYSILIPKDDAIFKSDIEFLNSCSSEEICDEKENLIKLNNGVTYCKAYSPNEKLQNESMPFFHKILLLTKRIRNTYLAKPTNGYQYCFVMRVSAESRYAKNSVIDDLVNYTLENNFLKVLTK